jgi:hypothetical protein
MPKRTLKTLVITSKITFVPGNYDHLITGLAACPQVGGLLIVDNRTWSTFGRSLGAMAQGAWRIGLTLLRNFVGDSQRRRERAYAQYAKPVWTLARLNSPETLSIIDAHRFDLLLNARTRVFFAPPLLQRPALGAINIHHGLLPEQRGTLCDLWSLARREPSGFSVHKMNSEIDAGDIVQAVTVSDGTDRDYLGYLQRSEREELRAVRAILADIETSGEVRGHANVRTGAGTRHKDPTWKDIRTIKRGALQL